MAERGLGGETDLGERMLEERREVFRDGCAEGAQRLERDPDDGGLRIVQKMEQEADGGLAGETDEHCGHLAADGKRRVVEQADEILRQRGIGKGRARGHGGPADERGVIVQSPADGAQRSLIAQPAERGDGRGTDGIREITAGMEENRDGTGMTDLTQGGDGEGADAGLELAGAVDERIQGVGRAKGGQGIAGGFGHGFIRIQRRREERREGRDVADFGEQMNGEPAVRGVLIMQEGEEIRCRDGDALEIFVELRERGPPNLRGLAVQPLSKSAKRRRVHVGKNE